MHVLATTASRFTKSDVLKRPPAWRRIKLIRKFCQEAFLLDHSKINRERLLMPAMILAVWTTFGLFFATQNYLRDINVGKTVNFSGYVVGWLLCGYAWGFLTVPVLRFLKRFSLARLRWSRFLLVHIPAGALFSLA